MGADFWATRVDFAAQWVSQSFPLARDAFELFPGQDAAGEIVLRNTGYAAWMPGVTNLGTTQPRDGASALAGPDWLSPSRAATVDRMVPPGETGTFRFTVRAPATPGDYPQFFTLVQESVAWFSDQGGPPDDQLQIRVTVLEPPPCPAGTGPDWACDGAARVRCVAGEVERATCEHGCAGGVCQDDPGMSGPIDRDGDGHADDVDCDDADPTVHPGAREVCDDGIDQNCDGFECHETEDGEIVERRIGTPLSSGCAAVPARSAPAWPLVALGALALVARRRRAR
ncbi:MAG: hypothetical protein KF729_08305 [Sandaracinaceae bacterium]|nr:hypothetical protein [Sandaracinaceae bacterium]